MTTCIRIIATAITIVAFVSSAEPADDAKIRIVFFTPKDVQPPENVRHRMKQVVDYGQAFYGKWLQHWGYEPENVLPIDRDRAGIPIVYFVKGTETAASGKYDKVGYQGAIREQAILKYQLPRHGSTWWIFVFGTKLKASRGLGGFGDTKGNGWALLVWHDVPGELSGDIPLAGGIADRMNLKGYLHELGHTMSLAHFGPHDRLSTGKGLGMSLMGPNARTYRRAKSNREQNVYLTSAAAALIWKQPQMTGRFDPQPRQPRIEVKDFKPVFDARKKRFRLTGQLKSNLPAHSIVAIDMPKKGPSDYWKKAYSSRLEKDGEFELVIDELAPSSGLLKVVFCFNNGYITGTGKGYGYKFSAEIPYQYVRNSYKIGVSAR